MPPLIFRKGLDLKHEVAGVLASSYRSELVDLVKNNGFQYASGRLTVHLAREFGFCYGVDRAVDYAYQARVRFPDRVVYLTGEIIHNPHVNGELRAQGIRFLSDEGESIERLNAEHVVILPAFGVTIELLSTLQERGCTLVDTTCGSVLNVWKNVKRYAEEGFTSIIHGKYRHEETRATASQALNTGTGQYLVVLDRQEADIVCDYIRSGGDPAEFRTRFEHAASPGFDPDRDLQRVGCANQTTMLSSESLEIGGMIREAMRDRYGDAELPARFRAFDTICSATQDRQDAVLALLEQQHGRSDAGHRRPEQQQHLQPGAYLCRAGPDVPHRRSSRPRVRRRDPPQAGRQPAGDDCHRLDPGRTRDDRVDVWSLDTRQPDGHRHPPSG